MNKYLNVAAILKDYLCDALYDLLHDIEVKLDYVSSGGDENVIWCIAERKGITTHFGYSEFGTERGWPNGLQILKPSKNMQDWSKAIWCEGDVLSMGVDDLCIFSKWLSRDFSKFEGRYVTNNDGSFTVRETLLTADWKKKEKSETISTYIASIEQHYGGKLDTTTLDIIKKVSKKNGFSKFPPDVNPVDRAFFEASCMKPLTYCLYRKDNDCWELGQFSRKIENPAGYMMINGLCLSAHYSIIPYEGFESLLGTRDLPEFSSHKHLVEGHEQNSESD